MNAEIVYQVVKALSKEEQKLLLDKLNKDFLYKKDFFKQKKTKPLKKADAINYLLRNVF